MARTALPFRDLPRTGMRRREVIGLLGGAAAAWPMAARAQHPERMRRIGILEAGIEDEQTRARLAAFRAGLEALGWREGRNLEIQLRWGGADAALIRRRAADLVGLSPDLILVQTAPAIRALLQETRTIPMVLVHASDPVGAGFVSSLSRPSGNLTGFVNFEYSMVGKWLEILKEIAPHISRVAVILNPDNPSTPRQLDAVAAAGATLRLRMVTAAARDDKDITRAITAFASEPNGGLLAMPIVLNTVHRKLIITLAAEHRLPAIYPLDYYAREGGLVAYGVEVRDLYRRAASYVDRILKGEKPGDLPIQLPSRFELVINTRTARQLGLTVPPMLLARADEVIE
jgi:putative ABC transport system substrate-binding protein